MECDATQLVLLHLRKAPCFLETSPQVPVSPFNATTLPLESLP